MKLIVAHEDIAFTAVVQRLVLPELARSTTHRLLRVHGRVKARLVHCDCALAAHVSRQIKRKTIGVVQLEGHVARQRPGVRRERRVQNLHADFQRLEEALLLGPQHVRDADGLRCQRRIGVAHQTRQIGHQPVEERRLLAQLVAMADGPAHDAAQHITAAFIGRDHAVAHQECGGADMVGDHPQRGIAQVGRAGLTGGSSDQALKDVDFVVAVHVLQDGRQPLQAHAGIHTRRRQFDQAAVGLHVELHEHVVPDLDETVTILFRAAGRAARDMGAVVVKNLAARATGAGVGHHPEII